MINIQQQLNSHQFSQKKREMIQMCPTIEPSQEEFNNFYQFIHHLDRTYKKDYGMVKIIPPKNWKPSSEKYQTSLQKLEIKHAIQQNVQGRGGFFESKNIVQKKMTFNAYKRYAEKENKKVMGKTIEQKQKLFWKTIMYSSPVYGADLTGTLMDQNTQSWNFNHLDSLLKYAMPYRVKGVTQPYCYIGTWKAFFSWHKEDLDLSAINYIHQGQSKIWYSIATQDSHILESAAKQNFRTQYQSCNQFLRHKTFLIDPQVLLNKFPNIKISKSYHQAGQIMLVFGGAYHEGFNCGFNIAEAVNYATLDWLKQILDTKHCSCSKKSVKAEIQSVLYNLQESQLFESLLANQEFQTLRNYVLYQRQLEEDKEKAIIASRQVKTQLFNSQEDHQCYHNIPKAQQINSSLVTPAPKTKFIHKKFRKTDKTNEIIQRMKKNQESMNIQSLNSDINHQSAYDSQNI